MSRESQAFEDLRGTRIALDRIAAAVEKIAAPQCQGTADEVLKYRSALLHLAAAADRFLRDTNWETKAKLEDAVRESQFALE